VSSVARQSKDKSYNRLVIPSVWADGSLVGCLKSLRVHQIKFLLPFVEQRQVHPLVFAHFTVCLPEGASVGSSLFSALLYGRRFSVAYGMHARGVIGGSPILRKFQSGLAFRRRCKMEREE
jgi:hypothetical protein